MISVKDIRFGYTTVAFTTQGEQKTGIITDLMLDEEEGESIWEIMDDSEENLGDCHMVPVSEPSLQIVEK